MGFQMHEMKDKNTMAGIYDSYLQHNQNKLKIFNLLRKDTQMRNSRLGLTQRESVPPSNTMSNTSKNKLINMSNDVRPFEQGNRRVQEINISQKIYTNQPEFTPNTFVSNNMDQEQDKETVDYRYPNNFNQKTVKQSFNNSRNFQNQNNNLNVTNRSEFNNYQKLDNSKNNYNNTSNNTNYPSFNNENPIRVRETNNSINEKIYTNKGTPSYIQSQEFISSNLRNSNSNQFRNNYYNNNNNYNSGNMNPNSQRMNIEPNYQPQVSYRQEIPIGINNNINQRREPDEESEFSLFSTFRKLKNTPLYKNKKHICVNIVLSLLIICLAIGFLKLINTNWDSITDYFSDLGNRGFVDAVFGFFSSVFFGTFRYFYITIPLVILIFLIVLALKKYLISKRCEEIFNNIVNDLRNGTTRSGNRYLSYEDMYRDYAKKYGISKEEFQKKYIKKLENMRRNKNGMKKFNQKDNNGNDIIFWEYDN
jgi:hypothetical protein